MPRPPHQWITPVLISQLVFSILLVASGIIHRIVNGTYSQILTGIYIGFFCGAAVLLQWRLKNRISGSSTFLRNWTFGLILFSVCLTSLNVPILAIFSILHGDAFGSPHKSCRWVGSEADMSCQVVTQATDVIAVICDGILILSGITSAILFSLSFLEFWRCTEQSFNPEDYMEPTT